MRCLLLGAVMLFACTDAGSVELPSDAARPLQPAAAVPAARPAAERVATGDEVSAPTQTESPALGADVRATQAAVVRRHIRPQLRGRGLAHKVYQARFGPTVDTGEPTRVVLTRHVVDGQVRLEGFGSAMDSASRFRPCTKMQRSSGSRRSCSATWTRMPTAS